MYSKGKELRNILIESFNDRDESFYYLAPDIVGSVANANMDVDKDIFIIDFSTTDGRDMNLKVKNDCINNWMGDEVNQNSNIIDFVKEFIQKSKSEDEFSENTLDEIVDEYGDIMPNDDMPNNSNNSMVGKSKFGSEKAIKQTIAKSKRYYGDLGLGVVTW
tara:strand:- start:12472 stop:12954 length:483 start_codon:yes stop_codon:yes gene_type:complete